MNIAMTGATGYIGKHLSNYLTEKGGHRIIPLGRAMFREGMSGLLVQTLTHCDVIINLAGAPINQRWTPEHKQELFNSRITSLNISEESDTPVNGSILFCRIRAILINKHYLCKRTFIEP